MRDAVLHQERAGIGVSEATVARQSQTAKMFQDIGSTFSSWRIWWLLGTGDIRQRYSRSKFGQFWITLSMAIFVVAIGSVYALLFKQPIAEFLPYIASNYVVWTLIAGILSDSSTVFVGAETFLRQEPLPKTLFVMRSLVRNVMNFAHNILIVPCVMIFMGVMPTWTWVLVPVGLFLIVLFGFFATLLLGVLCTRFRDLPQVVTNLVQIAFFITPVMWPSKSLRAEVFGIVEYNPFAALMNIVAEPMRGVVPDQWAYVLVLCSIVVLAAISLPLFARFRSRIVYWL